MSDPVSNNDIEDVLSSIRRLVANDAKTKESVKPDRLVLTPSQRVQDLDEPEEDALAGPGDEGADLDTDVTPAEEEAPAADDVNTVLTGLVALVEDEVAKALSPEAEAGDALDEDAPYAPEDQDIASAEPATDESSALEQKIAALEQLVASKGDDWEQDPESADSKGVFKAAPVRSMEDWKADLTDAVTSEPADDPHNMPEAEAQQTDLSVEDAQIADILDQEGLEIGLSVDDAQAEDIEAEGPAPAAVDPSDDVPEATVVQTPDATPEDASQPVWIDRYRNDQAEAEPRDDTVEADTVEEAQIVSAEAEQTEPADLLADNALTLDEEMLREMVGELVRQELQGVLGERITRNVRKLVRREIQRVLVSRDFE